MDDRPMVIAHHLIFTVYGTWLPNDPRGSGSINISIDEIEALGDPHYGRKRIQPTRKEIQDFQHRAAAVLHYPVKPFDTAMRMSVANAFATVIERERYTCYACAVMPDHVHLVIRKHKDLAERMVDCVRHESRTELIRSGAFGQDHPVWSASWGWKVFLFHPDEVRRTIRYVEENPLSLRLPIQRWSFVKPYDGWPLHPGHSPHSPYAK